MDRGSPASGRVLYVGHKNVTRGAADNGETPVIGEIAAITIFSSAQDENHEVVFKECKFATPKMCNLEIMRKSQYQRVRLKTSGVHHSSI